MFAGRVKRRARRPEAVAGGLLRLMLLTALVAAYAIPDLGARWPSWMWTF